MNKRIRLLAEQATTYIEPTATSGEGWIFNKEKFAELIVEECAKRAEVYAYMSPNFNALAEELRSMIGVAQ